MKVSHYLDIKPQEAVSGAAIREVITAADGAPNFNMRVIEVKPGSSTPYHNHPWEHEVFVLTGEGAVKGEQGETRIKQGSIVFIPPDEPHNFINNGSEPLCFI